MPYYKFKCSALACNAEYFADEDATGDDNPSLKDCVMSGCSGHYQLVVFSRGHAKEGSFRTWKTIPVNGKEWSANIANRMRGNLSRGVKRREMSRDDFGEERGDDAGSFSVAKRFHMPMRYTPESCNIDGLTGFIAYSVTKTLGGVFIFERRSAFRKILGNAGRIQGKPVMGLTAVEAAANAGRNLDRPRCGKEGTFQPVAWEWCHLVADSLGGASVTHNFVAASFCCNTYMGVIEGFLTGRGDLAVQVTSYGPAGAVADWIVYEIYKLQNGRPGASLGRWYICGKLLSFSAENASELKCDLLNRVGRGK